MTDVGPGMRKVSAQGSCTQDVFTRDAEGVLHPFSAPRFACRPWVLRRPVARDGDRGRMRGIPTQTPFS